MPDAEIASNAAHLVFFLLQAVMTQLLKILIHSLLDDCSSFVAPEIFDLHLVETVPVVIGEHSQVWLDPGGELLKGFFAVNFQSVVFIVSLE